MLKDTIISAFNYDGTLLKWLKKVEDALQGDTLTNIEVVTNSDYSMQLKLTFGDGTFILSPSFTNKGRGIVSITKTSTSGLVDTYTVTYTDNTTSTFTVTNAEGFNANNLYSTLTAGTGIELTNDGQSVTVTAKNLLSDIVDADGNKRFQTGTFNVVQGFADCEKQFALWTLNGYNFDAVATILFNADKAAFANSWIMQITRFEMPLWILNKIIPYNVTVGSATAPFVLALDTILIREGNLIDGPRIYLRKENDRLVFSQFAYFEYKQGDILRMAVSLVID